jgi:hypothetical protein
MAHSVDGGVISSRAGKNEGSVSGGIYPRDSTLSSVEWCGSSPLDTKTKIDVPCRIGGNRTVNKDSAVIRRGIRIVGSQSSVKHVPHGRARRV